MKFLLPAKSPRRARRRAESSRPLVEVLENRLQPGDTVITGLAAHLLLPDPGLAPFETDSLARVQDDLTRDALRRNTQADEIGMSFPAVISAAQPRSEVATFPAAPVVSSQPPSDPVPFATESPRATALNVLAGAAPAQDGPAVFTQSAAAMTFSRPTTPLLLRREAPLPQAEELEAITSTVGEEGALTPDTDTPEARVISRQRYETNGGPDAVTLDWSTYLASFSYDTTSAVAVQGTAQYVAGTTLGFDFVVRAFVARLDYDGTYGDVAFIDFEGAYYTSASALAVDNAGNIYLAGDTDVRFPGETTSAFALRLNADLQTIPWWRTYSATAAAGNTANMHDIAVNAAGTQVWMTGGINVVVNNRTDRGLLLGHHNAANGQQINGRWHRFVGSGFFTPAGATEGMDLAVNAQGIPYVAGAFLDLSDADELTQAVGARFNTNLTLDRYRYFTNNGIDLATGIVLDSGSNSYLTGTFSRPDGSGITNLMLAKYNAALTSTAYGFSYRNTNDASLLGAAIALNTLNQPILLGTIIEGEDSDALLYRMSTSNPPQFLDGVRLGGTTYDAGLGVATGPAGAVYVTGATLSLDFPTTAGVVQETAGGFGDGYLTKYTIV